MSRSQREARESQIHLVGIDLGHAITPVVHNFVALSIDVPWRLIATECPSVADCLRLFRSQDQAGGVVTMPWKREIMSHLDHLDEAAKAIRACNVVYFDESGGLCGTNTDWVGIEGAFRAAQAADDAVDRTVGLKVALVIGAGGAARAAIYALTVRFGVTEIYILNRDDDEVAELLQDCKGFRCTVTYVTSIEQAEKLACPAYIVGCVPDFEAVDPKERAVKEILTAFLSREDKKGIMLDMCYHPSPQTRNLQQAQRFGWRTVQGSEVVGHQIEAIWRFWVSEERLRRLDREALWTLFGKAVVADSAGRQKLNAEILEQHFGPV